MRGQPWGGRGEHEELLLWCLREEVRGRLYAVGLLHGCMHLKRKKMG